VRKCKFGYSSIQYEHALHETRNSSRTFKEISARERMSHDIKYRSHCLQRVTNCLRHSPFEEANTPSASRPPPPPRPSRTAKFPPLIPHLNYIDINPGHTFHPRFLKFILILPSRLQLDLHIYVKHLMKRKSVRRNTRKNLFFYSLFVLQGQIYICTKWI
jgi:hypothetical protein